MLCIELKTARVLCNTSQDLLVSVSAFGYFYASLILQLLALSIWLLYNRIEITIIVLLEQGLKHYVKTAS